MSMFHGGPIKAGAGTYTILSEQHGLLSKWGDTLTEPNLGNLATVLEIAARYVKVDGVVLLHPETTGEGMARFNVLGAWQSHAEGLDFPAWIEAGQTRAGTVLRDSLTDPAYWPKAYLELPPDTTHLRRSYYRHPPEGQDRIVDGLFDRCRGEARRDKKPNVQSAIFLPAEIFPDGTSILAFYSYASNEFGADFQNDVPDAVIFITKTFRYNLQGLGYRLISEINDALTNAASGPTLQEGRRLDQAITRIPELMADLLGYSTVIIHLAGLEPDGPPPIRYANRVDVPAPLIQLAEEAMGVGRVRLIANPWLEDSPPPLDPFHCHQSRPGKFGQVDKWISCLKAATMPHGRKDHDET